jgi:hypothetical protein
MRAAIEANNARVQRLRKQRQDLEVSLKSRMLQPSDAEYVLNNELRPLWRPCDDQPQCPHPAHMMSDLWVSHHRIDCGLPHPPSSACKRTYGR